MLDMVAQLPPESRQKYQGLQAKLQNIGSGLGISDQLAEKIVKKDGPVKLQTVFVALIDILSQDRNVECVPEHVEHIPVEEIYDFHHHYKGLFGDATHEIVIPTHWTLNDHGVKERDTYIDTLRSTYDPQPKARGLFKFFKR